MGNKKKKEQHKIAPKVVDVEFKISMYCEGCEKQVAKAISKIKGVEEFMTDMNKHKVVVKGRINADKMLKKLKKKTGKRVEMLTKKEENKKKGEEKEGDLSSFEAISPRQVADALILEFTGDSMLYTMFSDENANACSIM
ncbi:heavy metal-associated isoprenylated plant protein 19-like [Nicotiana tabacum]|uniref:Copper transport protein ATX1-like n=2 Tax=Nicotiana TaxID=4085 RepID=A0A1S3XGY5_TOBAC|nr:PREDICTED: copper transport protein ATX1 [Nicotiana sylvestris]XP_016439225.1 PREDICTED: copper transport protein ATX1-like [Nicotiana tabacum]